MPNPPPIQKDRNAHRADERRDEVAPAQPPRMEEQSASIRSESHYGAQNTQSGAQADKVNGGDPAQGYGTQMSGGTQSGQQSGSYSSDHGRGDRREVDGNGDRAAGDATQGEYSRPEVSDQDFSQQPGFGGYGPDGGGYGSQSNYASHNTYRSTGEPDVTQRPGAGTTSSHTGTGTRTEGHATGASAGATFGGATTPLTKEAHDRGSGHEGDETASRGPGSTDGLGGRSVSSSSPAKPRPE